MKRRKKRTFLWTLMGLLFSLAVLLVVFTGLTGQTLVTDQAGIPVTADSVLMAVHTGDWAALELLIAENYDLDPVTGEDGSPEQLIWEVYQQSLQWNCRNGFDIQGTQVIQNVSLTCLDIPALTRHMTRILPEVSKNVSEEHVLTAALSAALSEDPPALQKDIALTFVRKDGQWKVIPDNTLLALLSGFTAS